MTGLRVFQRLGVLFVLAACGNVPRDFPSVSEVLATMIPQPAAQVITADDLRRTLTPDVVSQLNTRLILIEIPARQAVAILSLVNTNQGVETYLTADGVSISLQDGLVVATRGFGFDLMTADVSEVAARLRHDMGNAVRIHRYLDGENQIIAQSFRCDLQFHDALSATETCKSSKVSFTNSYTFNESGRITESKQWVSPEIGLLEVQELN
ncbi:YjbF family lipoprotein [Yoonia sp. GPGPB17]|uniref:YjbF family lipoprotein n=1 Tax=Yoonia sp. GPGPB17 TaxID=3026147 RepID=UPI0030C3A19F